MPHSDRPDEVPDDVFAAARAGDRRALARLLTLVERGGEGAREIGRIVHPLTGSAVSIGLTGAPGAGKSTLTSALVAQFRALDRDIAVLAIDPSSPFTGGAILGDRVRMGDHALDPSVFIRSMATRGHLGGLAVAIPDAVHVLDAVGIGWVLIETVGVGQVEVDIAGEADTTVVVVTPGWGDAVQANKAGLMEIADVFVVNKADRAGASETVADLERMLSLRSSEGWRPPVITTVATTGEGVEAVREAIEAHQRWAIESGDRDRRRAARAAAELRRVVQVRLAERVDRIAVGDRWEQLRDQVADHRIDPWTAAEELLAQLDD